MIYRISLVLEAILFIKCIHDLYGEKFKVTLEFILFLASDLILMESIYQKYIPNWCNVLVYILIIVYCIKVFGMDIKPVLVNFALTLIVLCILQILCAGMIFFFMGKYLIEQAITLLTYLAMWCVYMLLSKVIKLNSISRYFQRPYILMRICLMVGCITIIVCILATKVYLEVYGTVYIIIAIPVIVICIVAVSWLKYREKAVAAEAQLNAYKLYESSYENLILEIRMRQHEFDNHINAIYGQHLLYKDYDSLVKHQQEYCKGLKFDGRYSKLLKVGDTTLAGFLYGKFIEAERNDIMVSYDIKTTSIMETIPEYKVIEIVGNLINNAMDALKMVENKLMNVQMYKNESYCFITVENVGDVLQPNEISGFFEKGYSSKGRNRGLGLYNIKKMSQEYEYDILYGNELRDGVNWIYFTVKKSI